MSKEISRRGLIKGALGLAAGSLVAGFYSSASQADGPEPVPCDWSGNNEDDCYCSPMCKKILGIKSESKGVIVREGSGCQSDYSPACLPEPTRLPDPTTPPEPTGLPSLPITEPVQSQEKRNNPPLCIILCVPPILVPIVIVTDQIIKAMIAEARKKPE